MKVIIAGSRTITSYDTVEDAVKQSGFGVTEVVSGCARGVDRLGERYAHQRGIKIRKFPANWDLHGKFAGFVRNREMAAYANALVALWDGQSRGTEHMIKIAKDCQLKVFVLESILDNGK